MRRAARWVMRGAAVLLGVPLLAVALLLGALNTGAGQRAAAGLAARASGGLVAVAGLSGRVPDAIRVARLEVRDARGVWLAMDGVALDWSPLALLSGEARIGRLAAARVALARLPEAAPAPAGAPTPAPGATLSLPVRVALASLSIGRLEIAAPVAGAPVALALEGGGSADSLDTLALDLTARAGGAGRYEVHAAFSPASVAARLDAEEPAGGLLSRLAGLPDLGAVALHAAAEGPWSGLAARLTLAAGSLAGSAHGTVDVPGRAMDLDLAANAPAMAPRAGLSWHAATAEAHVHGAWTRPEARARLDVDALAASGAALRRLAVAVDGDLGAVRLEATAEGVRLPGPAPDLLAAAPVTLRAAARLDDPARLVTFTLAHPLLAATGHATTAGTVAGALHLDIPDLAPLAALGAPEVQGHAAFDLTASLPGGVPTAALDGTLAITGGAAPLPGLLGPDARFSAAVALHDAALEVSRLRLDGRAMSLDAHGTAGGAALDVAWRAALPDLSVLAASVGGTLQGGGRVHGPLSDLAAEADLSGEVATAQVPRGPVAVALAVHGLPGAPSGRATATGTLDGAALALDLVARRAADGAAHLGITRADWKSLHAEGALDLAPAAALPTGRIALQMDRLGDLSRLLGRTLAGAVTADLSAEAAELRLKAAARDAGLAGAASVGTAALDVRVRDPLTTRTIAGRLDVAGLRAGGIGGTARLDASGTPAALALRLSTALADPGGAPLAASAAATLDAPGRRATVSALQADWHGQTLRLLAPMRIDAGAGIRVDRVRLGLGEAVLDVAGKVSPALDLTASVRNLPAALAGIVMPATHLAGTIEADAKLTGAPARPDGRLHLAATGLRLRDGPGASMPPAAIAADAVLAGGAATLHAQATAGANRIGIDGRVPLDPALAMDVRATAALDLATLDPLLAGAGRRAAGKLALDGGIAGTLAAPRATGTLTLAGGDIQDIPQGIHIGDIAVRIDAEGDSLRIARFSARAGQGSIAIAGTVGLAGTMPVDLTITGKNARPVASDLLSADLDLDLALRGAVLGALDISGGVRINRADIRVPDSLPASVAVLDVRRPGQAPPPPPAPGPAIGLAVTLTAPGQVFVRGRGLEAELQGRITVAGTAAAPLPSGRFTLRQGDFNLAGQTLRFASGEVGFNGARALDPTLNFVATSSTGSVAATLTIGGYASTPKIVLSSIPELPQDEILAQLLFHQSSSGLTPVQLAQAAAALAQISGAGGGFDPLGAVRQKLGLDRLSVSNSSAGTGASVEAGRYIAPRVYVGAKQNTSGDGTQAIVQFDVTRRLKLQATAGTSAPPSATGAAATDQSQATSVGVTYQFDY